ncbi:MAG: hypothetical protein JWP86_2464 [Phenylobacterium sp.]|nr:hypothetical protein [Phenylobacterium sp.]
MVYKPVDPASLSGDALDQWYRRPPDEIEAARQAAAQADHDAFFGQSNADDGATTQSDSDPSNTRSAAASTVEPVQLAAAKVSCPTCHGGGVAPPSLPHLPPFEPLPFPPVRVPPPLLPFPWSVISSFRDGAGGSGSGGSRRDSPKQCIVQEQNDEEFCRGPSIPIPRHECWSRTNQRWGHCRMTDGEVGNPALVRPEEWQAGERY